MASKLIVIEGLDGSGKGTQAGIITELLSNSGCKVRRLSFPDYDSPSSSLVKMYLDGSLGDNPDDVNAYAASSFYAVDRAASYIKNWKHDYESYDYIIADRYATSNIIYQMSKVEPDHRDDFIAWCEDYEYDRLGIPRPDVVIYLDMPPEVSQRLMTSRYNGDDSQKDIHEKNISFLLNCRESAMYAMKRLCWKHVVCAKSGEPRSIEDITQEIMTLIP